VEETGIVVDGQVGWEPFADGFRALHRYTVRAQGRGDTTQAVIEVTFAVDFASTQPMTEELFETFGGANLPVNTWPFLREFAAAATGRMGWMPITLPALKIGTAMRSPDPATTSKRSRRKVSAPTSPAVIER